jgi:NAD-dependent DNA ligase
MGSNYNALLDELDAFISALGIPLVGRGVAKEIVKYYPTWDDFMAAIGGDWTELEGFGPEIDRSLNNFDYTEADEIAAMLDFARTIKEYVPNVILTVVDVIGEEEIAKSQAIADSIGVTLRVRPLET